LVGKIRVNIKLNILRFWKYLCSSKQITREPYLLFSRIVTNTCCPLFETEFGRKIRVNITLNVLRFWKYLCSSKHMYDGILMFGLFS